MAKKVNQQGIVHLPGANVIGVSEYTPGKLSEMKWAMTNADGATDAKEGVAEVQMRIQNADEATTTVRRSAVSTISQEDAAAERIVEKGRLWRSGQMARAASGIRGGGLWPSRSCGSARPPIQDRAIALSNARGR